jgi:hypothetical protein
LFSSIYVWCRKSVWGPGTQSGPGRKRIIRGCSTNWATGSFEAADSKVPQRKAGCSPGVSRSTGSGFTTKQPPGALRATFPSRWRRLAIESKLNPCMDIGLALAPFERR